MVSSCPLLLAYLLIPPTLQVTCSELGLPTRGMINPNIILYLPLSRVAMINDCGVLARQNRS